MAMADKKPVILVVDDEEPNRELIRRVLEPEGYRVIEARDGDEALKLLKGDDLPDCVLLDVNMPGRDGFEICAEIKGQASTRLLPVVMVTGMSGHHERLKGMAHGADEFLGKPFDVAELRVRVRSLVALKRHTDHLEDATTVLSGIARLIARRDLHTGDHCGRVSDLAAALGSDLGMSEQECEDLRLGGLLHDMGKIAVPDAVLSKRGPLSPEEFELIKGHAAIGAELLAPLHVLRNALKLIRHHHERLDGSGYPDGLKGAQIPLAVRVLSVADIYDVLANRRPYKEPLPQAECLRILREEAAKGWWDPQVIAALEAHLARRAGE